MRFISQLAPAALAVVVTVLLGTSLAPAASSQASDPIILAAGDIAVCAANGDEQTAALLDEHAGAVLALGDTVYESGTPQEFQACYEPSWGRHKNRTHPTPGNHEYQTANASGYFGYFGAAAGPPGGYYSFDVGSWHIISLNSERDTAASGAQVRWLKNDLAASTADCVLAYWHRPRWTKGQYDDLTTVAPFWNALYDAGADVVLAGHDHNYQRYPPFGKSGNVDPAEGIRSFVVGTGGAGLVQLRSDGRREAGNASTLGLLELSLHPAGYDWEFIPVAGKTYSDSGTGRCNKPRKPVAVTGAATGLGQTSATLNGTVDPRGHPTTYFFEYGTTAAYGSSSATASAGSGFAAQPVAAALGGLTAGTTYHYRLVATNPLGTTRGADVTFTTASPPAPPPTTSTTTTTTTTTVPAPPPTTSTTAPPTVPPSTTTTVGRSQAPLPATQQLLIGGRTVRTRGRSVWIRLHCTEKAVAGCSGTLTLRSTRSTKQRRKTMTVGIARIALPAAGSRAYHVDLSAAARRLLSRRGSLPVRALVRLANAPAPGLTSRALKLKLVRRGLR